MPTAEQGSVSEPFVRAVPQDHPGGGDRGAVAWLLHPMVLVALAVLLVNDHLLKAAWPGLVTGKLSDVAGLILAPAVITVVVLLLIPWLPVRSVAAIVTVLVGALFALVKSTAAGAAAASTVWTWAWGPSVVLRDLTDLLTLPALALSWWAFRQRGYRHALPPRAVERIRLALVLPIAVLAILATSPIPYPSAYDVRMVGDLVVVDLGDGGEIESKDGLSWDQRDQIGQQEALEAVEADPVIPGRSGVCVPAAPQQCYRPVPERLAVEQSADGGATWTTAWSISPGRQLFLSRAYPGSNKSTDVAVADLAVVTVGDGHSVVVAAGYEGVVVRHPDGSWERKWVPTGQSRPSDEPLEPPAMTEPGARIAPDLVVTTMWVFLGLALGGVAAGGRGRQSLGLVPLVSVLFALGFAIVVVTLGAERVPSSRPAQVIALIALIGWLLTILGARALAWGRALVLAGSAVAAVALSVQPYLAWSSGATDSYDVAARTASQLIVLSIVAMTLIGLGFRLRDRRSP